MNFRDIEKVKMPIIYISLSFIISSICYGFYNDYLWLAIFSASLFLLYVLLKTNMLFTILISAFFTIGVLININYYSMELDKDFKGDLRLTEDKGYYKIGEYKEKRFYIEGDNLNFDIGSRLSIEGRVVEKIDKERGILGTIEVKEVYKLEDDIICKLYNIRKLIFNKLEENIGKRKAGLVSSLAFGYSDYLDSEDKEDMKNLGIIHAISVSGLHVALIYSIISKIFGRGISLGATTIYVIFTGAPFSAIRALIMIYCLALAFGVRKNYNPLAGLAISALIITIFKPYAPFQLGFSLSFLATLGIILYSNKINKKLYRLPKYLRETIGVSLGAQVFTVPLLIASFKELSLVFIVGNLILIPILNLIIILGNLLLIVILSPPIFDFISYVIIKIIYILDRITDYLYNTSSSLIVNDGIILIYVTTLLSLYYVHRGYKKFIILPVISLIIIMIYIYSPIIRIDYVKEGGILISYKGERKVITNKRNIDMGKIKKATLAEDGYREIKNISIKGNIGIKADGKDFILLLKGKEYLLRLNNKAEEKGKYDIINFVEGKNKGFYILNNELILY